MGKRLSFYCGPQKSSLPMERDRGSTQLQPLPAVPTFLWAIQAFSLLGAIRELGAHGVIVDLERKRACFSQNYSYNEPQVKLAIDSTDSIFQCEPPRPGPSPRNQILSTLFFLSQLRVSSQDQSQHQPFLLFLGPASGLLGVTP